MKDIIRDLSKKLGKTNKEVETYLNALQSIMEQAISDDKIVKISGLGTFKLIWNKPRKSVDVRNGEEIEIPGHYKLGFSPDASLRDMVNEPYAHLEVVELEDNNQQTSQQPSSQIKTQNPADEDNSEPMERLRAQARELTSLLGEIGPAHTQINNSNNTHTSTLETHTELVQQAQPQIIQQHIHESEPEPEHKPVQQSQPQTEPIEPTKPEPTPEHNEQKNIFGTNAIDDEKSNKSRRINKYVAIAAIVVLLCSLLPMGYFCMPNALLDYFKSDTTKPKHQQTVQANQEQQSTEQTVEQTIQTQPTTPAITPINAEINNDKVLTTAQLNSSFSGEIYDQKRLYSEFSDTVTLVEGSRLTWLSLKHLGHKTFWVYIYEANRDHVADPNNIPVGTRLRIPVINPILIDPNNPESVKYSKELHRYYVNKQ